MGHRYPRGRRKLSRIEFHYSLWEYQIPRHDDVEDYRKNLKNLNTWELHTFGCPANPGSFLNLSHLYAAILEKNHAYLMRRGMRSPGSLSPFSKGTRPARAQGAAGGAERHAEQTMTLRRVDKIRMVAYIQDRKFRGEVPAVGGEWSLRITFR